MHNFFEKVLILIASNIFYYYIQTGGELVRAENTAWRWPSVTVRCPPGKRMLAGGGNCKSLAGKGWMFIYESRPISANEFRVSCDTPEGQNALAEAYVVCR